MVLGALDLPLAWRIMAFFFWKQSSRWEVACELGTYCVWHWCVLHVFFNILINGSQFVWHRCCPGPQFIKWIHVLPWESRSREIGCYNDVSFWNLRGTSAALPRCLSNFRAIGIFETRILRLRDFARSEGMTPDRLMNRSPDSLSSRKYKDYVYGNR